jgi:diaminopimelate epimerase
MGRFLLRELTVIPFRKMHGTGNDFVIFDGRKKPLTLTPEQVKRLSNRRFGIGCDQLVILTLSKTADVGMEIYNADGSKISTCGNATRCVGDILLREKKKHSVTIETAAGIRTAQRAEGEQVRVNMGRPKWDWREIPLSESRNTLHLGLEEGGLADPVAVNMGNPHAIFFVRDTNFVRIAEWGAKLETHPLFPERANISAVEVLADDRLRMKVWERGTGETLACGSAACAAVVAGVRRGVCGRTANVELPGGTLTIEWREGEGNGEVYMTGAAAYVFEGELSLEP